MSSYCFTGHKISINKKTIHGIVLLNETARIWKLSIEIVCPESGNPEGIVICLSMWH